MKGNINTEENGVGMRLHTPMGEGGGGGKKYRETNPHYHKSGTCQEPSTYI